jgi:hypothetical protein
VDFSKALQKDTTIILFAGPDVRSAASSPFGQWLLRTIRLPLDFRDPPHTPLPLRKDLWPYLQDQVVFASPLILEGDERLAGEQESDYAAAVLVRREQASIYLVPLRALSGARAEAQRFLELVLTQDYPPYLDALNIGNEGEARREVESLRSRIADLDEVLEAARRVKRILYYTKVPLQAEVVRFLSGELAIPARLVEGVHEDFELIHSESAERWCIGEVKSRETGNVTRGHLASLAMHRTDAGLDDDYPALLVVNTFAHATNLAQRDAERVHVDVTRRAAEDHVVIVRTLDLVRIKNAILRMDSAPREALLGAIQSGGGWFEMSESGAFGLRTR